MPLAEPRLIRTDLPVRQEFPVLEGETRIGRAKANEIRLEDSAVSRFHCYLEREGPRVRFFNTRGKNPARVDGEVASGQLLQPGNTIRVGRCQFLYEGPPASAADAPPALPRPRPVRRSSLLRHRPQRPAASLAILVILFLALAPGVAWVLVEGLRRWMEAAEPGPPAPPPAPTAAGPLEGIERMVAGVLKAQEELAEAQADGARRMEELARRIEALEAALPGGGAPEPAVPVLPREAPPPAGESGDASFPGAELLEPDPPSSPTNGGEPTGRRRRTVGRTEAATVRRVAPRKRSAGEVQELLQKLRARIDDYATHLITPASLEPELTDLASTEGKPAAEALLEVHAHARKLLRDVEASIEDNRRRAEALERKADASKPRPASQAGPKLESDQRLLELSRKAEEIHREHRKHLLPLRAAVLAAFGVVEDPEAAAHLVVVFPREEDEELCRVLVAAVRRAAPREAIPALYRKLSSAADPGLKEALRGALCALSGVDLGDQPGPWAAWWKAQGEKELAR